MSLMPWMNELARVKDVNILEVFDTEAERSFILQIPATLLDSGETLVAMVDTVLEVRGKKRPSAEGQLVTSLISKFQPDEFSFSVDLGRGFEFRGAFTQDGVLNILLDWYKKIPVRKVYNVGDEDDFLNRGSDVPAAEEPGATYPQDQIVTDPRLPADQLPPNADPNLDLTNITDAGVVL